MPGVCETGVCWGSLRHTHANGKGLYLKGKGNSYWRDPFFTSMMMGGKVSTGEI